MLVWDTVTIFRHAGGRKGIIELCKRVAPNDPPPTDDQVNMWWHRRKISSDWLAVVCAGLLAAGVAPPELFAKRSANHPPPDPTELGL